MLYSDGKNKHPALYGQLCVYVLNIDTKTPKMLFKILPRIFKPKNKNKRTEPMLLYKDQENSAKYKNDQ